MVQNQRMSSFCIVLLALLLFVVNSAEPMPQNNPEIRRLVEIKTVDEKGVVKARVVAVYEPTRDSEGQKASSESGGESKGFQDDDEDSRLGDSETSGESYEMLAHDDPNSSANQSESSGSPSRSSDSINATSKPADSKSSTVLPTTSQINTSTTSPTTARLTLLTTTNTTSVPQTTSPVTTVGTKVTVTTGKQNVTTLSTLSPSTKDTRKNLTTISPKVTEVKTTTAPATTTSVPTTTSAPTTTTTVPTTSTTVPTTTAAPKPTKITRTTESNVTVGSPFEASTTARSNFTDQGITDNKTVAATKASVTTSNGPDIKGHKGPETKARRKTLFGFVTVEILIALLAGALFSVLLVAFLVYRLKKRNEGSYELSETIALRPKEIDEMGKKKEVFV